MMDSVNENNVYIYIRFAESKNGTVSHEGGASRSFIVCVPRTSMLHDVSWTWIHVHACLADVGGRERGVTRYNMIITPTAQVDRYNCRA